MERFYKTVDTNLASWHDPDFKYEVGKSRRPDTKGRIDRNGNPIPRDAVCSGWVLHASREPWDALRYATNKYEFRLLVVEGNPVSEQSDKAVFRQLRIVEEAPRALCFGPNGDAVVEVLDAVAGATADQLTQLAATRDATRAATRAATVADLVGQHSLKQHHIDKLMGPFVEVFGEPEWMKGN